MIVVEGEQKRAGRSVMNAARKKLTVKELIIGLDIIRDRARHFGTSFLVMRNPLVKRNQEGILQERSMSTANNQGPLRRA